MNKHQGMLQLLGNVGEDDPAAMTVATSYVNYPCLYISSDEDIILMNHAADAFVKNSYKHALFHTKSFHSNDRVLLDHMHICHLRQGQEKFPNFALFLVKKI